jgi:hypothetical protein
MLRISRYGTGRFDFPALERTKSGLALFRAGQVCTWRPRATRQAGPWPRRPLAVQCHVFEGSDKWPFHFPTHAANDLVCTFAAHAWFVGSVLDESRKNVRNS